MYVCVYVQRNWFHLFAIVTFTRTSNIPVRSNGFGKVQWRVYECRKGSVLFTISHKLQLEVCTQIHTHANIDPKNGSVNERRTDTSRFTERKFDICSTKVKYTIYALIGCMPMPMQRRHRPFLWQTKWETNNEMMEKMECEQKEKRIGRKFCRLRTFIWCAHWTKCIWCMLLCGRRCLRVCSVGAARAHTHTPFSYV